MLSRGVQKGQDERPAHRLHSCTCEHQDVAGRQSEAHARFPNKDNLLSPNASTLAARGYEPHILPIATAQDRRRLFIRGTKGVPRTKSEPSPYMIYGQILRMGYHASPYPALVSRWRRASPGSIMLFSSCDLAGRPSEQVSPMKLTAKALGLKISQKKSTFIE